MKQGRIDGEVERGHTHDAAEHGVWTALRFLNAVAVIDGVLPGRDRFEHLLGQHLRVALPFSSRRLCLPTSHTGTFQVLGVNNIRPVGCQAPSAGGPIWRLTASAKEYAGQRVSAYFPPSLTRLVKAILSFTNPAFRQRQSTDKASAGTSVLVVPFPACLLVNTGSAHVHRGSCLPIKSAYPGAMTDLPSLWLRLVGGAILGLTVGFTLVGLLSLAD